MAISDISNFEGIVLRITPVKEADAMVLAIGAEGFFSFYAHGVKKLTSKNAAILQPFVEGKFLLRKSTSGSLSLSESSLIASLQPKEGDLVAMAVDSIMLELTTRLVQEDESASLYPYLKAALAAINQGKDPYCAGLLYFARVLINMGIGLNVDGCTSCGNKKDIVALSLQEGGFLCKECANELMVEKTPLEQLKMYRYIFKAPLEDIGRVSFEPLLGKALYSELGRYVDDLTGVHLKSVDFLSQI